MSEKRTILFVDDEEKVLKSLQRGLMDEPYECLFATSGKQALDLLDKHTVHVICTDMRMPEMNGLELLKLVKDKHPHIVRLVLSGYTQVGMLLTAINQGEIFKFITKPWSLEEEFKGVIQQAMEYYNLKAERDRLAAELENYKKAGAEKVGATEEK
jgi:two-component system, NtrC family, response regulator HupR/HoxA